MMIAVRSAGIPDSQGILLSTNYDATIAILCLEWLRFHSVLVFFTAQQKIRTHSAHVWHEETRCTRHKNEYDSTVLLHVIVKETHINLAWSLNDFMSHYSKYNHML